MYVVVVEVLIGVGFVGGLSLDVSADVGKLVELAVDVSEVVIEAAVVELDVVELWEIGEV